MSGLEITSVLVVLAATFMYVNVKYIKLPSTIGLMLMACLLAATVLITGSIFPSFLSSAQALVSELDFADILLHIMLSFLLFAGAMQVNLSILRKEMLSIIVLASTGVLISTAIIGFATYYILPLIGVDLDLMYCLLFGALISPTDPIAVLAIMKQFKMDKNLETMIAGESLFNDGVGVVVFLTILNIATGGSAHGGEEITASSIAALFGQEVIGGVGLGALLGYLGFKLLDVIENEHVELEVLVTLSLVMGGTVLAENLHFSAPLAMVVCGLFLSNQGREDGKEEATGAYVYKFWHLMDETLNAILFILIGLEMIIVPFSWDKLLAAVIAVLVVLGGRLMGVTIPVKLFLFRKKFNTGTLRVLTWGGLRGGISVALALSLPEFPFKDYVVAMTYVVVIFSILVQGLTIPKLLERVNDK